MFALIRGTLCIAAVAAMSVLSDVKSIGKVDNFSGLDQDWLA